MSKGRPINQLSHLLLLRYLLIGQFCYKQFLFRLFEILMLSWYKQLEQYVHLSIASLYNLQLL